MDQMIYIIESECGRVKIGHSVRPEGRLATYHQHSPRPLRLIAVWPGTPADELALHQRFAEFRRHHEWFAPDGALGLFLCDVRGKGVERIPAWDDLDRAAVQREGARKQAAAMRARKQRVA